MKRVISVAAQFGLFLLVFALGSFLPPMRLRHVISVTSDGTRVFFWDGVVLMVVVLMAILAVEAGRRRLRMSGAGTAVAFLLALGVGLAAKLGFMTVSR